MDEEIGFEEYRICSTESWLSEEKASMVIPSLISSYTAQLLEAKELIKIEEDVQDGVEEEIIEAKITPLGLSCLLEDKEPVDIEFLIKDMDSKPPVFIGDTVNKKFPFLIADLGNEPSILIADVDNEAPALTKDKISNNNSNNNSTHLFERQDVISIDDDLVDEEISNENVELVDLTNKNKFKCDVCSKLLKTESTLKVHMKRHNKYNIISSDSSDDSDVTNRNCDIISSGSSDSNTSSSDESNPDDVPLRDRNSRKGFKCDVCSKRLHTKGSLELHSRMHCKCNICKKLFSNHDELKMHKVNMHAGDRSYKCEMCYKVFTRNHNLTTHMKKHVGTSDRGKECEQCLKVCASKHALKVHKLRMHATCKSYRCDICEKVFAHKDYFLFHMRVHSDVELHTCEKCSTVFCSKEQLAEHKQTQHPKKIMIFVCDVCNKKFVDANTLIQHQEIHLKPLKASHRCQFCERLFNTSAELSHHIVRIHRHIREMFLSMSGDLDSQAIVHTAINPYQHNDPKNSSDTNGSVANHATMHKWVNAYKCGICEKTFSTSDALSSHALSSHVSILPSSDKNG